MKCPECNGRGETTYYVETDRDENTVTIEQRKGICRTCNGSGEKPMTNADRIRAMSDKEIACFLAGKFTDTTTQRMVELGKMRSATEISVEADLWFRAWMQWLRQPAEVE